MEKKKVIIIGGGLSGLSAAVDLAGRGMSVLVLEQRHHFGGRTYSFFDEKTQDTVDNGQHLLMGCYSATRRYIKTIQTEHAFSLQPFLRIPFLSSSGMKNQFQCPTLPAPFHIVMGLLGFNVLSWSDKLKLVPLALEILTTSPEKEQRLETLTVEEWMNQLHQSRTVRKYLWDVITIGALNNQPSNVSALMLIRVLRAAFLGKRENASLLIPQKGLSDVLIHPAVKFIQDHGGQLRLGVGIEKIIANGKTVTGVTLVNGEKLQADYYISAVPWYALPHLVPGFEHLMESFRSSPIISIHLWFDRQVLDEEFTALVDTRVQWIFRKNSESAHDQRQHLSLVISGAQEFMDVSKEELLHIALEDLHAVLPESKNALLVHSLVIKEKRATFTPVPGLEAVRTSLQSGFTNLFFAGDWTNTGYPATIEGAVLSGQRAASRIP
jgi:hydroxysqualene dehydroxylase